MKPRKRVRYPKAEQVAKCEMEGKERSMNAQRVKQQLAENGTIGMLTARAHLPAIVEHVANGGTVTLTRRGEAVAVVGPVEKEGGK